MNYIKMLLIGMMVLCLFPSCADEEMDNKDFNTEQSKAELPVKEGYILDFYDEFDEPYLNPWKWLTKYFPHSTSPNSEGINATFAVNNGVLDLSITEQTKRFFPDDETNFRVSSIQTFEKNKLHPGTGNWTSVDKYNGYATKYGYFEMRAKLPSCGGGGHCAWWMIGCQDDADQNGDNFTESAEIDIIEPLFSNPKNSHPKIHPWTDANIKDWNQVVSNEGDLTNEFHVYAMDWTPDGLKFYFDGNLIAETTESPNYRMCMFLSIYASDDPNYWSGQDNGVYPKTFSIDYIRVWKLDTEYKGNDSGEGYKNESEIKTAVNGAYKKFRVNSHGYDNLYGSVYSSGRSGVNIFTEMCTDIMDCQWDDGGTWWKYHYHAWTASDYDHVGEIYRHYKSLSEFRKIVLDIEKSSVDESIKQKYIAEMAVLRGWLMYVLYDLYGPVPVADDATILENRDDLEIRTRPTDEVYRKLMIDEFVSAINNPALPDRSEEWGRVNRGVANMMLLKVYMKIGNWEEAEKVAREVTNEKYGYGLMDNYYDCFSKATEINKENIWSVICNNNDYVNGWITHVVPNTYPYENSNAELWGGYRMPWAFYETYEQGDKRLENIIGEYTSKDGILVNKENPGWELTKGALPLKYTVDPNQTGDKSGIDIPILRYSDALLSLSECIVRNGGTVTQEAIDLVNDVRKRAGLPLLNLLNYTSLDKYYDMLLLERGHELYCEGHRRTDLIRFGKYIEYNRKLDGSQTADYKVLYPIGSEYIDEGQQNSGY